jgi:hypothetical protein
MAASLFSLGCSPRIATAGFWYEDAPFTLPAHAAGRLDGPLTSDELASIKVISRAELERAFAEWRIRITDNPRAFWRVEVMRTLRGRGALPDAGESLSFGWIGGAGGVSFELVANEALRYAPTNATRQTIIEGIGRGIGRVAVHEFAHQILNAGAAHNAADDGSYEYPSPDRAGQYYGELHWTTARPLLEKALR